MVAEEQHATWIEDPFGEGLAVSPTKKKSCWESFWVRKSEGAEGGEGEMEWRSGLSDHLEATSRKDKRSKFVDDLMPK